MLNYIETSYLFYHIIILLNGKTIGTYQKYREFPAAHAAPHAAD